MKQKDALTQAFREEAMGQNPAEPNPNSPQYGCGWVILPLLILCFSVGVIVIKIRQQGASTIGTTKQPNYATTNMPPGWTLMCSEDGFFALRKDSTGLVYDNEQLVNKLKVEAVATAWLFYEDEKKPKPAPTRMELIERNWKECAP